MPDHSNRPGTLGMTDIYAATRASALDPWSEPFNLGPGVNSSDGAETRGRCPGLGAGWLRGEIQGPGGRGAARARAGRRAARARGRRRRQRGPVRPDAARAEVLALVAQGATNREIAADLFMAEKTASVHVSRILAKLDVRSRTEAAGVAVRLGLAR
jgi:DNA-binding CsgD family transcriptional regulator